MKRMIRGAVLTVLVLTALAAGALAAEDGGFTDVPADSWFAGGVEVVSRQGIMTGMGGSRFGPGEQVSWAQAVTIAARLHASAAGTTIPAPAEGEKWYDPLLRYAGEQGLLPSTCPEDAEGLNGPITRKELAYLFAVVGEELPAVNDSALSDMETIPEEFRDAAATVAAAGVMTGKPGGLFDPEGTTLRSEIAVVAARYLTPGLRIAADSRADLSAGNLSNFQYGGAAAEDGAGNSFLIHTRNTAEGGTVFDLVRRDAAGENVILHTVEERPKSLSWYEGSLYFLMTEPVSRNGRLYRMDPETGEIDTGFFPQQDRNLDLNTYTIYDGRFYVMGQYSDSGGIDDWRYRIARLNANGKPETLVNGLTFDQIVPLDELYGFGGRLYYIMRQEGAGKSLYRLDLTTGVQTVLHSDKLSGVVFDGPWLYCTRFEAGEYDTALYRIFLPTGGLERVADLPEGAADYFQVLYTYDGVCYLLTTTAKQVWRLEGDAFVKAFGLETAYYEGLNFFDGHVIISGVMPQMCVPEQTYVAELASPEEREVFSLFLGFREVRVEE